MLNAPYKRALVIIALSCVVFSQANAQQVPVPSIQEAITYYVGFPINWGRQIVHNAHGLLSVAKLIYGKNALLGGMINEEHPWVTGINPDTGELIWPENILFQSPRSKNYPETDTAIVSRVGRYMATMVRKSASTEEFPDGLPKYNERGFAVRRMPHGINYIHGAVHFNSGWILFNNMEDGFYHLSDPNFLKEMIRFIKTEQREVLLLFRDLNYDLDEFADFTTFVRSIYYWFGNPNGPKRKVLWGAPSPYPLMALTSSRWVAQVNLLRKPNGAEESVFPAIDVLGYFQEGLYEGTRLGPRWPEKLLTAATKLRIKLRGNRGNLYFTNQQTLQDPRALRNPLEIKPPEVNVISSQFSQLYMAASKEGMACEEAFFTAASAMGWELEFSRSLLGFSELSAFEQLSGNDITMASVASIVSRRLREVIN